jgi:SAM-dependent methyltransferase
MSPARCLVCGAEGTSVGGIVDPLSPTGRWDLWHCDGCRSAWATPLVLPDGYYDALYSAGRAVTGYLRYRRLARAVGRTSRPLDYLATQQDVYWAAQRFLDAHAPVGRVAEIGSGLGYLTHAIHQGGREVVGLDLSAEAVARACARYGHRYQVCNLDQPSPDLEEAFDAVIALEVIEHAIDPVQFVEDALGLVRPGGQLLVTTPDRDGFDPADRWRTDPPPVHFHWLGRRAMEVIAQRVGADVELIDFSDFNARHRQAVPQPSHELPTPFLGPDLRPLATAGVRERAIDLLDRSPRLSSPVRRVVRRRQGARRVGPTSSALAAVFRR